MKKFLSIIFFMLSTASFTEAEIFQVVGSEFPPLMYEDNGNPAGPSVELLQMMIKEMKGVEVKIGFYPVNRMLLMVSENKNTFTLSITRNQERESLFKWVSPICPRTSALFKLRNRSEIHVAKLEDVRSYKIGVGRGYAAVDDLLKAGIPRENIEEVTNDLLNIKKLFAGRIDFVANNGLVFAYLLKQEGHQMDEIEQAIILNAQYHYYYAFNKETDDLIIRQFQESLDHLRQNGEYDKLLNKYIFK